VMLNPVISSLKGIDRQRPMQTMDDRR